MKERPVMKIHLSPGQLAERYQLTTRTIARWRTDGGGPRFIKSGKNVFYPLEEVEAWEQERLRRSTFDEG